MSILAPFNAKAGSTVTVAASATAQDAALDPAAKQFMVTNQGADLVFVRLKFAGDATEATAADTPVLPNSQSTLTKQGGSPQDGHSLLSVVALGGAGSTVYVTSGEGW